ncbi:TetR/AcrR family transcriptional regulator [Sphingopyxis sp. BSN-002]|uniref:TetR/AcrR family transcriptional regulator n=1 Tax=Sphingopyxis sp. BSN-002 TaxID=2911495 RepID=UPI001EDB4486|nr:TetR/AcrR family transcriptional regulator [Sphingopyxis sp. BSN-002]UKK85836.1 TetR/AcrR family transcriptional regulator [Sphingopyxis sp. BSN-002]
MVKLFHRLAMASTAPLAPRAQRTRTALLAAGLDLLSEKPIDALSIDEVVLRAGVAKGSFFNHFDDKAAFGQAVGAVVREELEAWIGRANAGVVDPVERLAGGMATAFRFALEERTKAIVMLRSLSGVTTRAHPLNRGVVADLDAVEAMGLLGPEAARGGVRYWIGLCQVAMLNIIERPPEAGEGSVRLHDMIVLGLCGLGIDAAKARETAARASTV